MANLKSSRPQCLQQVFNSVALALVGTSRDGLSIPCTSPFGDPTLPVKHGLVLWNL